MPSTELVLNSQTPGTETALCALTAPMTSSQTTLPAGAAAPAAYQAVNFRALVETEMVLVTACTTATWTVVRGVSGSTAASHTSGKPVNHVWTLEGIQAVVASALAAFNPTAAQIAVVDTAFTTLLNVDTDLQTTLNNVDADLAPPAQLVSVDPSGLLNSTSRDVQDVLADFDGVITSLKTQLQAAPRRIDYNSTTQTWPANPNDGRMNIWMGPGTWTDGGWQASTVYTVGEAYDHGGTAYYVLTGYTSGTTFGTTDTSKTTTFSPGDEDAILLS